MSNTGAGWFPYTIPPTPAIGNSTDQYALSFKQNATPLKNPSEFLEWKKMDGGGLPEGAKFAEFAICENGEPKFYWFVFWESEPEVPEEEL